MKFYDDDPVELDCGCTAYAGEKYYIINVPFIKDKAIKVKKITYCGDNECMGRVLLDELDIDTHYISTAEDHECAYGDMKYDEWRDREV